jgi:hypothetical protein
MGPVKKKHASPAGATILIFRGAKVRKISEFCKINLVKTG